MYTKFEIEMTNSFLKKKFSFWFKIMLQRIWRFVISVRFLSPNCLKITLLPRPEFYCQIYIIERVFICNSNRYIIISIINSKKFVFEYQI